MYLAMGLAHERQRDLLRRAEADQRAYRVRRLQRARRRAPRAERNLSRALGEVMSARTGLHGGL
jgi:transcription initiation factor TFIIIB Brf1 subunit/transcription initiation factor TFIIB